MKIENVYAGMMTSDIEKASEWYAKLFDRKSDYHPMDNLYEWNFPNGGVFQLVQDNHRAGSSSITLMVDDLEKVKNELEEKNIKIEQQTKSDVANTATIFDPENNRITFAQNNQGRK
ncbi:VOC family protein [Constantimarinum furrinae]|uniref:Glyoxalase-like domain protein n=1 Tax=Constantimarinum furrinae TaxID=2562285 RepID=A0A7G8PUX7_9FLAO|nr:VOC family protein [Constantimarinum furrinae]QNJ98143.1 Glyoxalase-like domain protein [Constantimarinum furrinae]